MGSCVSKAPVEFSRLHHALNGNNIDTDDYFNASIKALDELKASVAYFPQYHDPAEAVPLEHAERLLKPHELVMKSGYTRFADGRVYIAVTIGIGRVPLTITVTFTCTWS
jgi:hypothetical protein